MHATDGPATRFSDPFERRVADALRTEPSPLARAAMDARVRAAVDAGLAPVRSAGRGSARRVGRRAVVAGLAFAMLVVAGAGGGLQSLYDAMIGGSGAFRTQWNAATLIGLSSTAHGYRVTVDRAYVDTNGVLIAITVADTANQSSSQVAAYGGDLVDDTGTTYSGMMGMSSPDGASTAANLGWYQPDRPITPGIRTFHLAVASVAVRDLSTLPPSEDPSWMPWHTVPGPWTFDFAVPVRTGSAAASRTSATVKGVTIHLRTVSATDATIRATIDVESARGGDGAWFPVGSFRHAGESFAIAMGGPSKAGGGPQTFETQGSTAERTGAWTLQVDELVGLDGAAQVRIEGPWILEFQMP